MSGPGAHATFGGSGAARLLACPGGYGLAVRAAADGSLRNTTSVYAAEGTVAHMLLEKVLGHLYSIRELRRMVRDGSEFPQDGHLIPVTDEMVDAVELFVEAVRPFMGAGWEYLVEQSVNLSKLWGHTSPVPLFGTVDFLAWSITTGRLVAADFKYGKGVGVEVRDNAQLLFYATGAALWLHSLGPSADVEIVVVQPRAPHPEGPVRRTRLLMLDLMMWAEDVLKPGVEAVLRDDAPLVTGDHCRWCPVLAVCPAMKAQAQALARRTFGVVPPDPQTLTPSELGSILDQAGPVEAWLAAVRGHAEARMMLGERVPGWKIVSKRSPRRWGNSSAVRHVLGNRGMADDEYLDIKLRSPAQLEKRLTPNDWRSIETFVDASSTGSAIARATDPRPPLRSSAAEVFTIDNGDC